MFAKLNKQEAPRNEERVSKTKPKQIFDPQHVHPDCNTPDSAISAISVETKSDDDLKKSSCSEVEEYFQQLQTQFPEVVELMKNLVKSRRP